MILLNGLHCTCDSDRPSLGRRCRHVRAQSSPLLAVLVALLCASCAQAEWEPPARRLTWAHVPLHATVAPELAAWSSSIQSAVDDLNSRVGCKLVVIDGGTDVSVELGSIDASQAEDADGWAYGIDPGTPQQRGRVVLLGASSTSEAYLVSYHELGHVLGLAHDLQGSSVMEPHVSDHDMDPLPLPALSDRDAAALAGVYCR